MLYVLNNALLLSSIAPLASISPMQQHAGQRKILITILQMESMNTSTKLGLSTYKNWLTPLQLQYTCMDSEECTSIALLLRMLELVRT